MSIHLTAASPVQVSGLSRQFDPLETTSNQIRKTSIIDELSLNVDINVTDDATSDVTKTTTTTRNGIFDYRHSIQVVDATNDVVKLLKQGPML